LEPDANATADEDADRKEPKNAFKEKEMKPFT
jgi:hypothetical protein